MAEESRHYHLRFVQGSFLSDDSQYGSATYGEDGYTYGQDQQQSIIPGTEYYLLPWPGWQPHDPAGWTARSGDTSQFTAVVVDQQNPSSFIDVSSVVSAQLVITQWTFAKPWKGIYPLQLNTANNQFYRDWQEGDLPVAGRFRVSIRILFESGRYLTVEGSDDPMLQVNDSTASEESSDAVPI